MRDKKMHSTDMLGLNHQSKNENDMETKINLHLLLMKNEVKKMYKFNLAAGVNVDNI